MKIIKEIGVIGTVLLMVALIGCGGGGTLTGTSTSSSGSSGSGGSGSNNTPPGIPNSIVFAPPASTNTVIALQGTGGKTNAEVTFQVNDASNTGVGGVPVSFALIPSTGDATLTTSTGTTDATGKVSTFAVSGNVHYSVVVQASISTPSGTKTANSNSLAITTGIPTEGKFGLAVSNLTAGNAADTLGITDTVTVQLSDRFSNPAPDGTAVTFIANQGQMQGQCLTVSGNCSAIWTSSALASTQNLPTVAGQVEILATTVGEESFTDVDNDGVFDNSDVFTAGGADEFSVPSNPGSDDIGEIYMDGAETGSYVSNDAFFDFNHDGVRNGPDGHFYGFGCKGTATVPCGSRSTIGIGKQICINMSTSGALIVPNSLPPITVTGSPATGVNVSFAVSDLNGHALASGTTVALISTITNGTVTLPVNLPFTYADTACGPNVQNFTVNITQTPAVPPAVALPVTGSIQLVVITPGTGGAKTSTSVITLQ